MSRCQFQMDLPAEKMPRAYTDTCKTKHTWHPYVPKCYANFKQIALCTYSSPLPSSCNNFLVVIDHFDNPPYNKW